MRVARRPWSGQVRSIHTTPSSSANTLAGSSRKHVGQSAVVLCSTFIIVTLIRWLALAGRRSRQAGGTLFVDVLPGVVFVVGGVDTWMPM